MAAENPAELSAGRRCPQSPWSRFRMALRALRDVILGDGAWRMIRSEKQVLAFSKLAAPSTAGCDPSLVRKSTPDVSGSLIPCFDAYGLPLPPHMTSRKMKEARRGSQLRLRLVSAGTDPVDGSRCCEKIEATWFLVIGNNLGAPGDSALRAIEAAPSSVNCAD